MPHLKTTRILLADDSIDERFLAERALNRILAPPSCVRVVSCGEEAISYMIGEGKFSDREAYPFPTLVITDLKMPHGDGFHILEFLRENPAWSVVPRVVFSASDHEDDIRTAFLLGASAYHVKSSTMAEMEAEMRQILSYWASSKVPPVDEHGRLLRTDSSGRLGAHYPQLQGGDRMRRPASFDVT